MTSNTTSTTNTVCAVEGCNEPKYTYKSGKHHMCRVHKNEYSREYYAQKPGLKAEENARYFAKKEGHTYRNSYDGYWYILGTAHPASNPSGITMLHRLILWDKVDGDDVACAECGGQLIWFSSDLNYNLYVDHVDGNKDNNDPSNLEPVHNSCNIKRGWVRRKALKAAQAGEAA